MKRAAIKEESAPPQDRLFPKRTSYSDCIGLPGYQPHEPLTPDDRADFDVLLAAAERGYRLAVQCTCCGHWLTNRKSVAAHMGPRCRAKAEAS